MLIISGLAVLLSAMMLLSPDSDLGRALRIRLVEAPARALNRLGRGKVVFFALLAAAGLTLALLFEADGLHLFGLMLPDLMVWFAVFDAGVFIDALLIAAAVLAANGLGAVRARVGALPRMIGRLVARTAARARRPRRTRPRPIGGSTDDDLPGWAYQTVGYRAVSMA
ncbi:MAG: hypothetical protein ACOH1E_03100 [Brevundimonas sp.]